jgi:hypothetical protein
MRFIVVNLWENSRGKIMSFDVNDPTDLAELKSEIENDPLGLGYDVDGNSSVLVGLINEDNPAFIVSKPKISSALVRSATTYDAFEGLLGPEENWLQWMTGSNGFEEENMVVTPDLRASLVGPGSASIWAVADRTEMNAAMLALIDVPGSRAEILWGYGTTISQSDWFAARDS